MSDITIECVSVSKKFKKGELHDSLRDLIPAIASQIFKKDLAHSLGKKEFWALDDVSFEVKRGEALGIIGHNGAGKSTLLKILSGIMKPTHGEFRIHGKLSALIEVGAGFHPDLTGRENVFLNGLILGMSRQEVKKKFDEIVHFSGLEDFIDTPVKRYSSGMYARLGFSVAAHVNPDVLLVDEVLSVGDWAFQRKCADKMEELVKTGATIIFISHNLPAVINLCNACILLERGRVVRTGYPEEVVKFYFETLSQTSGGQSPDEVFISNVAVLKEGNEESQFMAGDEAVVIVNVGSNIDCHDLGLHIELRSNNDYQVFEVYTELLDCGGFSLKKGETREFKVELSMHLAAGVYHLGVFIVDRHNVTKRYDRKFPAATLYVESHVSVRCLANLYPRMLSS
jgi:ABC-type polysaccharide/polyol phosphate transport system ATPase subunit